MKKRITGMAMMIALLAACGQAPERAAESAHTATPVATVEAAAATVTVAATEPSIEDGVDPSVWDNEGEPESEPESEPPPAADAELACTDDPLATYFFTLVGGNSVDDCGRKDPKVLAAFDALMKGTQDAESSDKAIKPLRARLLSGPSAPGQPYQLQGETWWFYTACQAHQCPNTALAMLYSPAQATMVGRLTARCRVWWLGEPTDEQRALIEHEQPLDEAMLKDEGASCE